MNDDELLAAYRRASAHDGRGPNPRVREHVLAQVRREHAPAAANASTWQWRAVAGIAVIGFVGLLARHSFRDVAPHSEAVAAAPRSASPWTVAPAAPAATMAAPRAISAGAAKSAAGPAVRLRGEPVPVAAAKATADSAAQARAAAPAAAPAIASRVGALDAVRQPQSGELVPDETLVRRAVTAQFPALFLPVDSDQLNLVTVLMNRSGGIDRSEVTTISASEAATEDAAAPQRFRSLNLSPDDIAASGYLRLVKKSAALGEPDKVLLVRYTWPREARQ